MKKALIASTALVLTAGVAAADVTISGYGRTGIIYLENIDDTTPSPNETQVISRLRMNIDATTSTDQGVEFGGRFRLQWDQNNSNRGEQGQLNAGKLFVTASGLTVEIGNVDTAFDSAGLAYASELGSYDRSIGGNPGGSFFAYSSDRLRSQNYMGVMAKYSVDALTVRASYVDPDQTGLTDGAGFEEELGISADYTWNDRLELSAAAVNNGSGLEGNDQYFLGARYAVLENARIGLNYYDNGWVSGVGSIGETVTLYGDYTLADGLTNIEAYVANNNNEGNETDNAFGVGVNYDLGGARLGASLQRGYQEQITADMGVRFNF